MLNKGNIQKCTIMQQQKASAVTLYLDSVFWFFCLAQLVLSSSWRLFLGNWAFPIFILVPDHFQWNACQTTTSHAASVSKWRTNKVAGLNKMRWEKKNPAKTWQMQLIHRVNISGKSASTAILKTPSWLGAEFQTLVFGILAKLKESDFYPPFNIICKASESNDFSAWQRSETSW